jgi:hypothetical protein
VLKLTYSKVEVETFFRGSYIRIPVNKGREGDRGGWEGRGVEGRRVQYEGRRVQYEGVS